MQFAQGQTIRATGLYPIADSEIKTKSTELPFSVTNIGESHMKITIKLIDIAIDEGLKDIDFRWGLYNTDTNKAVSYGAFKYSEANKEETLIQDVIIDSTNPDSTKNYTLRVWIHENGAPQNTLMTQNFSGKVYVTGEVVEYTPENCFTFDNATGTISAYDSTKCGKNVVIPKTIGGTIVTTINANGMTFAPDDLSSVILPDTVTNVSSFGFMQNFSVTLPENVTYYGATGLDLTPNPRNFPENLTGRLFMYYNSGTITVIPPNVSSFEAMSGNGVRSMIFMDGISTIEHGGACGYSDTIIEIPRTVTSIESGAFSYCSSNLEKIIIRGKTSLSGFTNSTGITELEGYENLIEFRP